MGGLHSGLALEIARFPKLYKRLTVGGWVAPAGLRRGSEGVHFPKYAGILASQHIPSPSPSCWVP